MTNNPENSVNLDCIQKRIDGQRSMNRLLNMRGMVSVAALMCLVSCRSPQSGEGDSNKNRNTTSLDVQPCLTLPFASGQHWNLTHGYNQNPEDCVPDDNEERDDSHCDYGSKFGDDRYALDFALAGCR